MDMEPPAPPGPEPDGAPPTGADLRPASLWIGSAWHRRTKQRAAVLALLSDTGVFRTAREIYTALNDSGAGAGLSTVYRVLQALVDEGEIDVIRQGSADVL